MQIHFDFHVSTIYYRQSLALSGFKFTSFSNISIFNIRHFTNIAWRGSEKYMDRKNNTFTSISIKHNYVFIQIQLFKSKITGKYI